MDPSVKASFTQPLVIFYLLFRDNSCPCTESRLWTAKWQNSKHLPDSGGCPSGWIPKVPALFGLENPKPWEATLPPPELKVPVGFCSPKEELPNPKVFAPLFPNKLEESGEMKNIYKQPILIADNVLHCTSLAEAGERKMTFLSPTPKHTLNITLKTTQGEAKFSLIPTGLCSSTKIHSGSDGPLTTLYCCNLVNHQEG